MSPVGICNMHQELLIDDEGDGDGDGNENTTF